MGFWDSFNGTTTAYRAFLDSLRANRRSIRSIDQALDGLVRWKSEFQSLYSEARLERNSTAATSRINAEIDKINNQNNRFLDERNKLSEQATRLEDAIRRTEESLRIDHQQNLSAMKRGGNAWKGITQRINDKEAKLRDMKQKVSDIRFG
jgi:chromosome segregation ATPase